MASMTRFGREQELEHVEQALARALSGAGSLLLFTGEAGIGKSSVAREAAERAASRRMRVLWGRCWEAGGAVPYWPWVQVFRGLDLDPFRDVPVEAHDFQQQRFRLFDAATQQLLSIARFEPLAILLDDLHAADVASLYLVLFIARQLAAAPIFLLGTAREPEARVSPAILEALTKIGREGEQISLRRLTREEVARWVAGAADADEVFRVTEGNPLFVKEMLRVGVGGTSDGIKFVIDQHLRFLPEQVRALVGFASVFGRALDARDLSALAGMGQGVVRELLRTACEMGVVEILDAACFQFTHVLLRDRLYEMLPERSALEWKAGLLLDEAGADPAIVAHHLLEGASAGDVERAARGALRAAQQAEAGLAFEAAASLAERALALLGSVPSRLACELEVALGTALMRSGSVEAGKARCARAAERARALGAADELARAALAYSFEMIAATIDPVMVRLLEDARAALGSGDSLLGARVAARLAAALVPPKTQEETARVLALAREAIAVARRIGDEEALLYTLLYARAATIPLVHADESFALTQEVVDLARAQKQRIVLVTVGPKLATGLLERGRRADADAALLEIVQLDAALRYPLTGWRVPMLRAAFAMFDGRFDEVERLGDEALAMAEKAGTRQADVLWAQQRITLAMARGEPARIAPHAERLLAAFGRKAFFGSEAFQAWVLAALGRLDDARAGLEESAQRLQLYPLIFAAEVCVLLEARDAAARIYSRLHELWQRTAFPFFWGGLAAAFAIGPTPRVLGELARLTGRRHEARELLEQSIALCRRIGSKPFLELSLAALERLHREDGVSPRPAPPREARHARLEREGDVWAIEGPTGTRFLVKHSKGLSYLSTLLASPGRSFHVLALMGVEHRAGDAGPLLDARARADYQARLQSLDDEIAEAESFGDLERARRGREELEALAEQLAGAVGLAGRERRAASDVERARINVQRCIKDALDRIAKSDPELGRYLVATVTTGISCSFTPI